MSAGAGRLDLAAPDSRPAPADDDAGVPMRVGRTLARYAAGALLLAVLITGGLVVRIVQFASPSSVTQADAILVLGAAQYNGRPSPVFQARLDHAIDLYRAGYAPHILTLGGGQAGDATTEGEAGRRYLAQAGIDPDAIISVPVGVDTLISLRAARAVMTTEQWTSAILVTDAWHMARSRMMARDLGMTVQTSPVTTGPAAAASVRQRYLLRELAGALFYRLVGGSSGAGSAVL